MKKVRILIEVDGVLTPLGFPTPEDESNQDPRMVHPNGVDDAVRDTIFETITTTDDFIWWR
jgi:hypothetical protein